MSNRAVHQWLAKWVGPASGFQCACGQTAEDWAYQRTGEIQFSDGRGLYSENPRDYLPMCRRCHRKLDEAKGDPNIGKAQAQRIQSDPAYAEKVREVMRANARTRSERMKSDPEFAEIYRILGRDAMSRMHKRRRTCDECGLVSAPGSLGAHQSFTGHTGWSEQHG